MIENLLRWPEPKILIALGIFLFVAAVIAFVVFCIFRMPVENYFTAGYYRELRQQEKGEKK